MMCLFVLKLIEVKSEGVAMVQKYYAVYRGRQPGIYTSWPECQRQVQGFLGARFKSFPSQAQAQAWLDQGGNLDGSLNAKPQLVSRQPEEYDLVIYTDGGSRNHGNYRGGHVLNDDKAAWAFVAFTKQKQILVEATNGEYGATNNKMEVTAFLQALRYLEQLGRFNLKVLFVLDSRYVLDAVTKGWLNSWQRRNWRKADGQVVLNQELWQAVAQLLPKFTNLDYSWTKGHANNQGNLYVDQLLNRTMDQM